MTAFARLNHLIMALAIALTAIWSSRNAMASGNPDAPPGASAPVFDPALAARHAADERGMRRYVLVVLKTGPKRMPEGDARREMFAGHFANITRLADAGKLAVAGPFMDAETGWRGLFILAVESVEEAQSLTATDPVIINGEMVAEYHLWYGSAALMAVPELHNRLVPPAATRAD